MHSKIYLKDNKIYLEDCGSKFGTLVLAKEKLEINNNPKIIQIGRTLVSTFLSNKDSMYQFYKKRPSEDKIETKLQNCDNMKELCFLNTSKV